MVFTPTAGLVRGNVQPGGDLTDCKLLFHWWGGGASIAVRLSVAVFVLGLSVRQCTPEWAIEGG